MQLTRILNERHDNIEVSSIPVRSETKNTDLGESILSYHKHFEVRSIELSLQFEWITTTDITNFYGSIYTHSIAWAVDGREVAKELRQKSKLLGSIIDMGISRMQGGQTNGIPQGCVLMDFISELVTKYIDSHLQLNVLRGTNSLVLRYRDDYRIFTKSREEGQRILDRLSVILRDLNLKLNASKSASHSNILGYSVKADKQHANYIGLSDAATKTHYKRALQLRAFSEKFPNSGQLASHLQALGEEAQTNKRQDAYAMPIIALCVDLLKTSPRHTVLLLGIIIEYMKPLNVQDVQTVFDSLDTLRETMPYSDLFDVWAYRIYTAYGRDITSLQDHVLNRVASGNDISASDIWNSEEWLAPSMESLIDAEQFCNYIKFSIDNVSVKYDNIKIFRC